MKPEVGLGVRVAVGLGVRVAVGLGVRVAVGVEVVVDVAVGVGVGGAVAVSVGVAEGVSVAIGVSVGVGVISWELSTSKLTTCPWVTSPLKTSNVMTPSGPRRLADNRYSPSPKGVPVI